ncbi:toll/interleukin-1 receptor domain-containing protein [Sphingomonas aurantiaca]|uniref:toll/interleukin-1 receptor domain-containing protein n=1 Tax=Sphingomonas aurantiaca TaxID=185949 RepID=UPI0033579D3B
MPPSTKPLLAVYVAFHPSFGRGEAIAEHLKAHLRRDLFDSVAGGTGLSVLFRSVPAHGSDLPLPIDETEASVSAVVALADVETVRDPAWRGYIAGLSAQAEETGLGLRVLPVSFDATTLDLVPENAIRVDQWTGDEPALLDRLVTEIVFELCRMLRHYLEHLRRPLDPMSELDRYLQPVRVFISHSKHDAVGEPIAKRVRARLHEGRGLSSFFDVHDIPAGLRSEQVLLHRVSQSAVIAIHTDTYSSREWCRREIIEAKRANVPLVVANCIGDRDERGFPYMGNVPIVRVDPDSNDRLDAIIARLLDEVLKDFLWKCRVQSVSDYTADVVFLPRPPELISLASLPPTTEMPAPLVVYPDPPLSREEERLFEAVAPHVRLRSMTEWLAEAE